jgi:NAD(P)H-dependent flavin oxidoreductase YrpB (nitropropane dioxygenase family)
MKEQSIIAMAMNQVSDIHLAIAVRQAGAIPSLSIFNYSSLEGLEDDLFKYQSEFGDSKILLSVGVRQIANNRVLDSIIANRIELVELIPAHLEEAGADDVTVETALEVLKNNNVKVFEKCLGISPKYRNIFGVILKGNEGAGRGKESLSKLFDVIVENYPVIVSGGIGTAEHVKYYIDRGAWAVGIGTLFAASLESKVSDETKLKMIDAESVNIQNFKKGAKQNALIFKELDGDDYNHTLGISKGVQDPNQGHIFAGKSIDQVTSIRHVSEIIKELVSKL